MSAIYWIGETLMSRLAVTIEDRTFEVELMSSPENNDEILVKVDGQTIPVILPDRQVRVEEMEWAIVDERPYEVVLDADLHWIKSHLGLYQLDVRDLNASVDRPLSGDGRVKAPIPGQITRVMVAVGQEVQAGQPLIVLEAMKMENEIRAPRSGKVKALHVSPGKSVFLNEMLAEIG